MAKNYPANDRGGSISRPQLEAIIRRAAELYAAEADADHGVSEEELVRIAAELGLPSRLVLQALYESAAETAEPSLIDRLCGSAQVAVARVVPGEQEITFRKLEEYLVTREYLQVTRRQPGRAWFLPADDLISKVIRTITRPSSRHALGRSRGVALAVQPLEEERSHVRLELNFASLRRDYLITGGVVGGVPVGLVVGGLGTLLAEGIMGTFGVAGVAASLGTGMLASATAGMGVAAAAFRRHRRAAAAEAESLLDRVESSEDLDPPLPPWRRRLRGRLLRSYLRF